MVTNGPESAQPAESDAATSSSVQYDPSATLGDPSHAGGEAPDVDVTLPPHEIRNADTASTQGRSIAADFATRS